jgi:hypothetical protein
MKIESNSLSEEKKIIIGLVVSTEYCEKIHKYIRPEYFKNKYLKLISDWSLAFYEKYKKAPYKNIQSIFIKKSKKLKEADVELIKELLDNLSDQYVEGEVNIDYLMDTTLAYIKKRKLEIVTNNVLILQEKGEIEEAEQELLKYETLQSEIANEFYTIKLGDMEVNEEIYDPKKAERKFFKLPGDLGEYLGEMHRSELVAYFAPAKVGKTMVLIDHFKHAVLQKRKTVFFSLEMTKEEVVPRVNKVFVPMAKEEGIYTYPEFDCVLNQTGECVDRRSPVVLFDPETGEVKDDSHITCDKCMRTDPERYKKAIYRQSIFREQEDIFTIRKKFKNKSRLLGNYGRIVVYPKYSLTYNDLVRELDNLIRNDNFVPDIIIIDYADILKFDSKYSDFKLEDERWKMLAALAGEMKALVITATQANLAGHKSETLDSTHQGGFYGKNRHVNLMVGLNQKKEEKEKGIMEFGITEARSQFYVQGQTCTVLQNFETGQVFLDSYCKHLWGKKI